MHTKTSLVGTSLALAVGLALGACGGGGSEDGSGAHRDRNGAKRRGDDRDDRDDRGSAGLLGSGSASSPIAQRLADAQRASAQAQQRVTRIQAELARIEKHTTEVIAASERAVTDDDFRAAIGSLEQLARDRATLEELIAQAQLDVLTSSRVFEVTVSKECQDNPLAKGCL